MSSVTLGWNPNPDSDLAGYRVYYGITSGQYQQARGQGIDVGMTLTPSEPAAAISGLQVGRTYYFSVSAYDSSGNESELAAEVRAVVE